MEKIRLLVLTYMYPNKMDFNSGIFIHRQIKSLMASGCKVRVISPVPFSPKILWSKPRWKSYGLIPENGSIDGVHIYYPRYIRIPGIWFYGFSCSTMYYGIRRSICSIVSKFRPQVIHAHMATPTGYIGLMLSKKYKLPLVCSLRGSDIHTYPKFGRLSMRLTQKVTSEADQLVSVSNDLKKTANKIAKPKKEIKRVYNGCDYDTIFYREKDRVTIREKTGISKNDKVIIYVGRILKSKGIYELVYAFIKLNKKYRHLHLSLVGNGPESERIKKIVSSNGYNKKIHLVGSVLHHNIAQWLSAADIFVLPSNNEGLPNVILEAMSCELPVIATQVGGIPEAVEDGRSGILINKEDREALVQSIDHLIENEELAKKMGRYGRQIIEQKFSWQKNAEEMIRIYREVMDR